MNIVKSLLFCIAVLFFAAVPVFADTVDFTDSVIYWDFDGPGGSAGYESPATHQNSDDVNGMPNFLGGSVNYSGAGNIITSLEIRYTPGSGMRSGSWTSYTSRDIWYNRLKFGDLFLNTNSLTTDWDYIVSEGNIYDVQSLGFGYEDDPLYFGTDYSDPGNDAWPYSGTPRWDHPVYAAEGVLLDTLKVGTVSYAPGADNTGWVTDLNSGVALASWTFDDPAFDLALGYNFTFGITANCANDVLLETVVLSTPEPASFLLLALGVIGLGLLKRRMES